MSVNAQSLCRGVALLRPVRQWRSFAIFSTCHSSLIVAKWQCQAKVFRRACLPDRRDSGRSSATPLRVKNGAADRFRRGSVSWPLRSRCWRCSRCSRLARMRRVRARTTLCSAPRATRSRAQPFACASRPRRARRARRWQRFTPTRRSPSPRRIRCKLTASAITISMRLSGRYQIQITGTGHHRHDDVSRRDSRGGFNVRRLRQQHHRFRPDTGRKFKRRGKRVHRGNIFDWKLFAIVAECHRKFIGGRPAPLH